MVSHVRVTNHIPINDVMVLYQVTVSGYGVEPGVPLAGDSKFKQLHSNSQLTLSGSYVPAAQVTAGAGY